MRMSMGTRLSKTQIMEGITGATEVRKLGSNTVRYRYGKTRVVRLFYTNVVIRTPKYIILDSGGFRTKVTKSRINQHQPLCYITQENYQWKVYVIKTQKTHVFMDGMKIYDSGKVELPKFPF